MKQLTKSAKFREAIGDALAHYRARREEIEQPIQDMHAGFDDLERQYAVDNNNVTIANAIGAPTWHKFEVEKNMRKALRTDDNHRDNKLGTANRILGVGEVTVPEMTEYQANSIIRDFRRIKPESNGYRGLRNFGTVATTLGGAYAGARTASQLNPGSTAVGLVGGAIAGGVGGYFGLNAALKNSIENRDANIYDNQEATYQKAYDRIRARYE